MKTFKKIIAGMSAMAVITSLAACSKTDTPDTVTQTAATAPTPAYTEPVVTYTETATTPVVTEPAEDLTSIPTLDVLAENINSTLASMTGFEMTSNVKGFVPDEDFFSNSEGDMVEHSFTLSTATDVTHLVSSTRDLNTNEETKYEEYQSLSDNIVTTLTQFDGKWVDNTPKEMFRYNMLTKSYASLPLIGVFADSSAAVVEAYGTNNEITRSENGDYVITVHDWRMDNFDSEFGQHGFCGLFRSSSIGDILANTSLDSKKGDCIYTFDKTFKPVSISFDIYNTDNYNADFYGLDLHGEVKFSKWNAINDIYLPKVSSAVVSTDNTATETATTTATVTSETQGVETTATQTAAPETQNTETDANAIPAPVTTAATT